MPRSARRAQRTGIGESDRCERLPLSPPPALAPVWQECTWNPCHAYTCLGEKFDAPEPAWAGETFNSRDGVVNQGIWGELDARG